MTIDDILKKKIIIHFALMNNMVMELMLIQYEIHICFFFLFFFLLIFIKLISFNLLSQSRK